MKVLYISSAVIGVLGIFIGIAMIDVKSALDAWWKLASIFSGGMLGLFLLAAFSRIKNHIAPVIGAISGVVVILWISLTALARQDAPGTYIHEFLAIVFGTLTIFLVGFLASWVFFGEKRISHR